MPQKQPSLSPTSASAHVQPYFPSSYPRNNICADTYVVCCQRLITKAFYTSQGWGASARACPFSHYRNGGRTALKFGI